MTKIQETLGKLSSVVSVEGDPHTKQVVVTMRDGQRELTAIEEAIASIGHVIGEER